MMTLNFILGYTSKRYLLKITLSVTIFSLLILSVYSITQYYSVNGIVMDMQRDNNRKVLSQINFNLSYMSEITRNMGISLLYDNDLIQLMNGSNLDSYEVNKIREKILNMAWYSSFLHSIVVYYGRSDQVIWGGNTNLQDPDYVYHANLRKLLNDPRQIRNMKLMPMSLHQDGRTDIFSAVYFNGITYREGQSVIALNLNTQWLFDNIEIINNLSGQDNERIFVMDDRGSIISPDPEYRLDAAMSEAIIRHTSGAAPDYFLYEGSDGKKIIKHGDRRLESDRDSAL